MLVFIQSPSCSHIHTHAGAHNCQKRLRLRQKHSCVDMREVRSWLSLLPHIREVTVVTVWYCQRVTQQFERRAYFHGSQKKEAFYCPCPTDNTVLPSDHPRMILKEKASPTRSLKICFRALRSCFATEMAVTSQLFLTQKCVVGHQVHAIKNCVSSHFQHPVQQHNNRHQIFTLAWSIWALEPPSAMFTQNSRC